MNDKSSVEDRCYDEFKIPITIYDVEWFTNNVVNDEQLVLLYETFIESNIHEFQKPDKSYVVGNFITDPRLFVFLRQQFDSNVSSSKIEKTLADSLILFSLEGTASEKGIFKSSTVIKGDVAKFVKFNPRALNLTIDTQLIKLSTKPRQINHHRKADVYCLPYPTRLKLRAVSYTHLTLPTIYSV